RRVGKDYVFFAFAGLRVDGARFAEEAMRRGAFAIVSESPKPAGVLGDWGEVEHGRRTLATAAPNFYRKPDERGAFTGSTGTNGKTTTSYLLDSILREAAWTTGLIGTIEYRMAGEARPAVNTTPESLDVLKFASELAERPGTRRGLTMEVSSHALALGRV